MSAGIDFSTCGSLPHELEFMGVSSPLGANTPPGDDPAHPSDVVIGEKRQKDELSAFPPRNSVGRELFHLFRIALPICVSYFNQFAVFQIALRYAGTLLGIEALAGASMGMMYCNCFGFSFIFGMTNALDTLLFQAHGNDPKSPLIMLYIQRSVFILLLMTLPVAVLWCFAAPVLRLTGQKPEVAAMGGTYIYYNLANLPLGILYEILRKFLMCVHNLNVVVVASLILTSLSPFVFKGMIGLIGIGGCSLTISFFFFSIVTFATIYILAQKKLYQGLWHGFSWAIFHDWKQFFLLGIPSALMLLLEWGVFELNGLASGRLGVETLGTMSICMQILTLVYMLPLGVNVAVSVRVGRSLGEGNTSKAKRAVISSSVLMAIVVLLDAILLWFTRGLVPRFFSGDPRLLQLYKEIVPLLIIFHTLDSTLCLCNGTVKGMGYPKYGFYFLFGAYAFGVPLGWVLAFRLGMGFKGIWLGPLLGLVGGTVGYLIFFLRVDWSKAQKKAAERIHRGQKKFLMDNKTKPFTIETST